MCDYVEASGGLYTLPELFAEAAVAAEEIAARLLVEKGLNPLKRKDFITITNRLHDQLKRKALPPERKAVERALQKLDLDWVNLSPAQKNKAIDTFNQALAGLVPARLTAVPVLQGESKAIVAGTKTATIQKFKLGIDSSFTRKDQAVADSVAGMQANFITDNTGDIVDGTTAWVRKQVSDLAEEGLSSAAIAESLVVGVSAQTLGKASNYWHVVATAFVGRARTYEQLVAYSDAQIDYYTWESVLDERTTEVCRFMHGKRFSTQASMQRFRAAEAAVKAGGARGVKDTQPWVTVTRNAEGKQLLVARTSKGTHVLAQVDEPGYGEVDRIGSYSNAADVPTLESFGVSTPPAHGMCRSTVVADV